MDSQVEPTAVLPGAGKGDGIGESTTPSNIEESQVEPMAPGAGGESTTPPMIEVVEEKEGNNASGFAGGGSGSITHGGPGSLKETPF